MKRLKIILQSNLFYVLILILCSFYCLLFIVNRKEKEVKISNYYEGIVTDYEIDETKVSLTIKGNDNFKVNYYKSISEDDICYGCKVRVYGTLAKPQNNTIPHAFNYKKHLNNNDIFYIIKASKIERVEECHSIIYKIKNTILERINKIDQTGYMKAFVLGDKSDLENYSVFQDLGVAHLFAISGMHIGLFVAFLLKVFKGFNKYIKYILVELFLIIYGLILGFTPSILRCVLFFTFNSINKLFNINISSMKLLLSTIMCILFINPLMIYNVGFQFSCMTVMGIIYCKDYLYGNIFVKSLKLSFVAFLFSFPISLLNFYSINLISILFNLLYIPYITFVIYPLCLISFFVPVLFSLFNILIGLMDKISYYLSYITIFRINMSLNVYEVILVYIVLFVMFRFNDFKYLLIIIGILLVDYLMPYFDSNSYVYFFDVGQGDSSLIISANRKDVVLIDTGGLDTYDVSDNVIDLLNYLGINKIDLIILSHGDADHCKEIGSYIKKKKVKHIKINNDDLTDCEITAINNISTLEYKPKKMSITFLNNRMYDNENDNSNITLIDISDTKILSMGDASYKVEQDLLKDYYFKDIDILKVGHHGSKTSSSRYFINVIKPTYSIISVGRNNRYGHPNKETLNNLKNTKIYRTDKDGTVMFQIKNKNIKIELYSP